MNDVVKQIYQLDGACWIAALEVSFDAGIIVDALNGEILGAYVIR